MVQAALALEAVLSVLIDVTPDRDPVLALQITNAVLDLLIFDDVSVRVRVYAPVADHLSADNSIMLVHLDRVHTLVTGRLIEDGSIVTDSPVRDLPTVPPRVILPLRHTLFTPIESHSSPFRGVSTNSSLLLKLSADDSSLLLMALPLIRKKRLIK